jgi:PHP-associated
MAGRAVAVAIAVLAWAAPAQAATWFPGDLHVHTCYSHDAYCGPTDDNTDPDVIYSSGGTVMQRFLESSGKGLAFLAITDHEDIRAQSDPDYGSHGVVPIAAYEASLSGGHAQMLGATRLFAEGNGDAASTNALADALRAAGGVFQANHPSYRQGATIKSCADAELANAKQNPMHWKYGFDVRPDVIEVWNATSLIQPSEVFWECWLQRGARIGMTGGSDSHGATQPHIGFPTTWVNAPSSKQADVLAALRAGRTTVSRLPERMGGVRLVLEADRNRDGKYESGIGDQVPPGTPMRVRADNLPGRGLVVVRANGRTAVPGQDLEPGGSVDFNAPAGEPAGWVRASLYLDEGKLAVDPACGPGFPTGEAIDACSHDIATAAMTSPIWLGPEAPPEKPPPGGGPPPTTTPDDQEPDDDRPLPPRHQSGDPSHMPDVPPQRGRGARVKSLRVAWWHRTKLKRPRVLIHWSAIRGPFDLQVRRGGGRWHRLKETGGKRRVIVRLRRGRWAFRIRSHPAFGRPGPWTTRKVRI